VPFSTLSQTVNRVTHSLASPLLPGQYLELLNPLWSQSCRGRITRIYRETDAAVTLVIQPNMHWQGAEPGQYVRLGVDVDGVRYWRNYSVTSAQMPGDTTFSVTVGKVDGGRVSTHIQESLRVGDVIQLDQAAGDFVLPADVRTPLLFISGGTGITPMMGMLRRLLAVGAQADVVHLHFALDAPRCLFLDELRTFNRRDGFAMHQRFTETGDGFFSADMLNEVCPDWREREAYVCGPLPLMDSVRDHWTSADLTDALHVEAFQPARAEVPAGAGGTVSFWSAGVDAEGAGDKPLLEVAEEAGLTPKHGCRMGICQECVTTLREGQVRDLTTGEVFGEAGDAVRICVCAAAGNVSLDL